MRLAPSTLLVLLALSSPAAGRCLLGDRAAADRSALAAARADIEAACPCASAASRRAYRACARPRTRAVRPACRPVLADHIRRSTCGLGAAGRVVPCLRRRGRAVACRLRAEDRCERGGRTACPGYTHCVDAADSSGDGLIGAGDSGACAVLPSSATVARWERFTVGVDRPVEAANPFDQAEVAVTGEFRAPSGRLVTVAGFVTRDYTRALVDGVERRTPAGEPRWEVRVAPDEEGDWAWRWRLATPARTDYSPWRRLTVVPAAAGTHGFVRRSPDSRYLRFDDGTPFLALGENMAWYDARGTFAYDEWLVRLAAVGGTYVRLWMPSWAFGLEWIERDAAGTIVRNTLGNYTDRLDRAWQLDHVLELARRHGIVVMLAIQNHGAFSTLFNSEWADNPYNAANGGPLAAPHEVFTHPEARALFARRLRYVAARWGYSPNVLAWELWNEVDLVDGARREDVAAWHREMAAVLRAHDPHRHLVSTSTSLDAHAILAGGDAPHAALWALDEIDFTQAHYYGARGSLDVDFSMALPALAARFRQRFGKPFLVGETGVDFRGPAETLAADPEGDGFHDMLWAGVLGETFGTGMTWWWDNVIDPEGLYFHLRPVAALVAGVDPAAEAFTAGGAVATAPDGRPLRALTLRGRETTLVWVKNARHHYYSPDPTPVAGATLRLEGLGETVWRVTWIDTRTATTTGGPDLTPAAGVGVLSVPTFARDVALRLARVPGES